MNRSSHNTRESLLRKTAPLLSLIPATIACLLFRASSDSGPNTDIYYLTFFLAISLGGLIAIPLTNTRVKYYTAQTIAVTFYLLTIPTTVGLPRIQLILHLIFLAEIILYEPFPNNLFGTLSITAMVPLIGGLVAAVELNQTGIIQDAGTIVVLPCVVIAFFGSLMTKHRELVVGLVSERERLTNSVVDLTRTNSAYQDYAVVVQESATETERRRITRDIHDIVGYTLTNNMMLMEAALDLLKENALALPTIIETARENAQEGLDQVRAAMYKLREQENSFPIGLNAIIRLARIFEQATGIKANLEFRNMPTVISDEIDSVIYHLIQEALVNAFRHGNARAVNVSFWYDEREVQVTIRDDGTGAEKINEGIGIMGMRERVAKVGGSLQTQGVVDGFMVSAVIPLPETK